jgi:signal transduction histidine kinase
MPCGLVRIIGPELEAWVTDPKRTIKVTVFDGSDGVRSQSHLGGYSPHVAKSADGKLWFVPDGGISVVDPRHIFFNKLPPPVHVEQVTADHKTQEASANVHLPPLVRELEIDYTALSFVAPEKVLFRYQLEGYDRDWQNVGARRQAFYTNLPPGNYRFRVTACNNSGVWNTQGASLDFSIAPAYWQTLWFRALCGAAFLGLLVLLYWLRVRQLAHQFNIKLDARIDERTRIARELHDTLLQNFQGVLLQFRAALRLLSKQPGKSEEVLSSAIDQAAEAIKVGREAVQGLRVSAQESNDLAAAIGRLGQDLAASQGGADVPAIRVVMEGAARNLHPIIRDEIFRVAGEALRNAMQHSHGSHVEVELWYDPREFRLRVRDDGQGIDQQILDAGGRQGHFGLRGMRERARLVGGKLTVWSAPGEGTEVELIIPGAKAYGALRRSRPREPS